MINNTTDISVPHDWAYGDNVAAVNAAMSPKETQGPARAIRCGTAGDLYLIRSADAGATEVLVAKSVLAGETIRVQFYRIGGSTTCGQLTAYY